MARSLLELNFFQQTADEQSHKPAEARSNYLLIYLEMLDQQRRLLNAMNHRTKFDEELIRKYLSLVDLEELKLREKQAQEMNAG